LNTEGSLIGLLDPQVLTGDDECHLLTISYEMSRTVAEALEGLDFFLAAEMVQRLGNLSVIDHPTVKRLLAEALGKVHQFFQSAADKVKDDCYFAR